MNRDYIKFYPILLVLPIWFYTVITQNLWHDIFSKYWQVSIAMIFGSFIAGSTPLGGGIVAFPINVLILKLSSSESRDVSILLQSVGMNAASYLLITTKSHLLHKPIIYVNIVFGCCGMMIGLASHESPELINLIYTITVLCFGILYFYTNIISKDTANIGLGINSVDLETNTDDIDDINAQQYTKTDVFVFGLMGFFGLIGGFITASVGSGSDIAVFVFGVYVWNILYPGHMIDHNTLTASSVVVMGMMSALTVITRALSVDGFSNESMLCFGAVSFIVVMGAPIGSLVLKPKNLKYLQYIFYILAFVQFILFSALKIKNNVMVWIIIGIIIAVLITLLCIHYVIKKRLSKFNNPVTSLEKYVNSNKHDETHQNQNALELTSKVNTS